MQIIIEPNGTARCVYGEQIDLAELGQTQIRRASHVEPNADGNWTADMSACDGPLLGPFTRRSAAICAELDWLDKHWLSSTHDCS